MNIHPIFVHFPVALLTIYSLMELLRFNTVTKHSSWFYIKAIFLFLGGLGALAALMTGDKAVEFGTFHPLVSNVGQVINMHKNFASLTIGIYSLLGAGYAIAWIKNQRWENALRVRSWQPLWNVLSRISSFILSPAVSILLALAGLIAITVTGGLGGMLVYGPHADPLFGAIYNILF